MITKQDVERILQRDGDGSPVLSFFLDLSVDGNNKRRASVFLSQKRAQLAEMNGALGPNGAGAAFDRVEAWLASDFDEANRGAAIYASADNGWFEAVQFPIPVPNRVVVGDRPYVAPLAQVIRSYRHYGVVLLDREHVRLLSVYLGTLLDEVEYRADPMPTNNQIQAGGYAQQRFQRRKLEEMKHFFKDFAEVVAEFDGRWSPDELVLLGTDENIGRFREYLPEPLMKKVVYTGPMPVDAGGAEVISRLEPHLRAEQDRHEAELLVQLRERVANDYLAVAGPQATLTALQEGRTDTLVLARDAEREGCRCARCGFVFARTLTACPYDGSTDLQPVDVSEEMVRLAEGQEAQVVFVDEPEVTALRGAAALLRY